MVSIAFRSFEALRLTEAFDSDDLGTNAGNHMDPNLACWCEVCTTASARSSSIYNRMFVILPKGNG